MPLMRRQLLKIMLPAEQALSMVLFTADTLAKADAGDDTAATLLRILTPLLKFRACRDARKVTGDAMEVRGGCGYIEDWIEPRLMRDAHLGSIWEGTSNVVALDVMRAARKLDAHKVLIAALQERLREVPAELGGELEHVFERTLALIDAALRDATSERLARQAASALYHAASAAVMASEAMALAATDDDARRLVLARLVIDHRLSERDPLAPGHLAHAAAVEAALLSDARLAFDDAYALAC
jgi:hypothetical protein